MKSYVVLLEDSNLIVSRKENLIETCMRFIQIDDTFSESSISIYQSFVFAECTGYVQKVSDEIDFILQCNENTFYSSVEEFAKNWGLTDYLDYDVINLSGGWRKYLGLALFTNNLSHNKIFFDVCRHLADDLILLFKQNLKNTSVSNVFFLEYDVNLIRDPYMIYVLYKEGMLYKDFTSLIKGNTITDSNYEQFA